MVSDKGGIGGMMCCLPPHASLTCPGRWAQVGPCPHGGVLEAPSACTNLRSSTDKFRAALRASGRVKGMRSATLTRAGQSLA